MRSIRHLIPAIAFLMLSYAGRAQNSSDTTGWISLFDGKTLNGWTVGENASTFKVENGTIAVNGPVAHLFYSGNVENHDFRDFEFIAEVMTLPGSNSGIYFHTAYQEKSWPSKGFEVQVNNSHTDWKRTGSLYDVVDVRENYAKDNEWFTEHITVKGKTVTVKVNGKTVVEYTEPDDKPAGRNPGRRFSSGTFALQGHDPGSKVFYRNIRVRPIK